ASTVVNYQANGDGDIVVAKRFNLLKDLIFVDLEVFLVESGDWSALTVPHRCLQDNQVRIRSNHVRANLVWLWGVLRHRNAGHKNQKKERKQTAFLNCTSFHGLFRC